MKAKLFAILCLCAFLSFHAAAQEPSTLDSAFDKDADVRSDRVTFRLTKAQRGTSVPIDEDVVIRFCSDMDGCELRLGMFNEYNKGKVASRQSIFYYNRVNRAWRASRDDLQGTNNNGKSEHAMSLMSCHFTDGKYENYEVLGDPDVGFGLLGWKDHDAECFLTIID